MVVGASEREEAEEEEEVVVIWRGGCAGAASVELDVCALRLLLMGF